VRESGDVGHPVTRALYVHDDPEGDAVVVITATIRVRK
jgi:hypothetical protein